MIVRKTLTPHVLLLAELTGKPLSRITKNEWSRIACRVEIDMRRGGLLSTKPVIVSAKLPRLLSLNDDYVSNTDWSKIIDLTRSRTRLNTGFVITTADIAEGSRRGPFATIRQPKLHNVSIATKKRGAPTKWTPNLIKLCVSEFERLRTELGLGKRLSDLQTAKLALKRALPELQTRELTKRSKRLAGELSYLRRALKGAAEE